MVRRHYVSGILSYGNTLFRNLFTAEPLWAAASSQRFIFYFDLYPVSADSSAGEEIREKEISQGIINR